jgi:hypothetical protein
MRGDGRNQLQISAHLPLKNIFQMIPLSAQSISLDSPFNIYNLFKKEKDDIKGHYGKNSGSRIADWWQRCQRTMEKIAVAE